MCSSDLHLLCDVPIRIQRERRRIVPQIFLHRLDVIPRLDGHDRIVVPLWHNKDNRKPLALQRVGGLSLFFFH